MQNPPYIAVAIITPTLTFFFFWLLETYKSAKQNKLANICALRSIYFELSMADEMLKNKDTYRAYWISGHQAKFKTNIWENFCGQIVISQKDRESIESIYRSLMVLNNSANFYIDISEKNKMRGEQYKELEEMYDKTMPEAVNKLQIVIAETKDTIQRSIDNLGKENWWLTVLKEFLGPFHKIVKFFQAFPNKPSATKN